MTDDSEYKVSDFSMVRVQLDDILVEQISKLIEIDLAAAALSFNLATITSLFLLVDREKEIQGSPRNPPERYDMQSFLRELEDIGLEIDDDLLAALQSLAQCGYIEKDSNDRYYANISAFTLVAFLDNLFPGMKGLNLVGYIVQTITEVVSGRRKLEDARMFLQQTLFAQGVSLSRQTFAHSQKENLKNQVKQHSMNQALADDMKKAYLERLETLKSLKDEVSSKPAFISRYGSVSSDNLKIREVFPRSRQETSDKPISKPTAPAPPAPEKTYERTVDEIRPEPVPEISQSAPEEKSVAAPELKPEIQPEVKTESSTEIAAEPKPQPEPEKEPERQPQTFVSETADLKPIQEPESSRTAMPQPAEPQILSEHKPDHDETSESKTTVQKTSDEQIYPEEKKAAPEPSNIQDRTPAKISQPEPEEDYDESEHDNEREHPIEDEIDDDEIARRIAAFSEELALPCPVCEKGRVKSGETEKGRIYFKCTNHTCNFVSWSKPYNFKCPICNNHFLVEYTTPDGELSLKCPRATCSYTQKGILNPAAAVTSTPALSSGGGEAPKKKKLVRRVKKKI